MENDENSIVGIVEGICGAGTLGDLISFKDLTVFGKGFWLFNVHQSSISYSHGEGLNY